MPDAPLPIPPDAVRWIKALLSGDYVQGTGRLCTTTPTGDEYCCLGVAARLMNMFVGQRKVWMWREDLQEDVVIVEGYVSDPVNGVDSINSEILSGPAWRNLLGDGIDLEQNEVADANDGGVSFAGIVDCHILPAYNHTRATFEEMYGPVSSQS